MGIILDRLFFANDYNCICHPKVLEKLGELSMVPRPGYGTDEGTALASKKILDACGIPEGGVYYCAGGTQANMICISWLLKEDYQGVVCARTGHIGCHEAGAIEATGHKVLLLPQEGDKVTAAGLKQYLTDFYGDGSWDHFVQPGMVYLSFPTEFGSLYTKQELTDIYGVCREYGMPLYIDGARLGYALASPACDITLKDLPSLCDLFYIGGTKVGALFGEAIVFPKGLPPLFHTHAKNKGALLAKTFACAAQFDALFTDDLYLKISAHAIDTAMKLKQGLLAKGYTLRIDSATNQQFVVLGNEAYERISEAAVCEKWEKKDEDHTVVRFATSWSTKEEDIDRLLALL